MAFIQPCFIIKNTPELRKKLEELGVIYDGYYGQNNDFIVVDYGPYNNKYDTVNTLPSNVSYHTYDGYKTFDYMDCGDNEKLFFALAALRDDSVINQYFICDKVSVTLGKTYYSGDYLYYQYDEFFDKQNWHKATVEELIEHFKKE